MRAWSSLHLIVVASYFSLRDSCSCAPRLLIHYTGRPSSDWRAETLRELPIARVECGQRRCRRAIVRVEVFDLNCLRLGGQLTDGFVVGISRFDSFRIRAHPFVGSPQLACRSAAPVRGRKDTGSRADSRANPRVACRCLGTVSIIRQHRVHSHRSFSTQRNATDDAWIVRESGDAARHDFGRGFGSVFGGAVSAAATARVGWIARAAEPQFGTGLAKSKRS